MDSVSLLSIQSRVEVPFVKVTIGDYTFGVYDKKSYKGEDINGAYKLNKIKYPNYIKSLNVQKVNGTVNKYRLDLTYAITERDDPNFFEKVFSTVSKERTIMFSYGDLSSPAYIYKNEEALIVDITSSISLPSSSITYTVTAISSAYKLTLGAFTFRERYAKPSDVIKELLYNKTYGLQEVFYGMLDKGLVEQSGLILSDDKKVKIEMKSNISILDYLNYLVDCMTSCSSTNNNLLKDTVYALTIHDDLSGKFNGPYFKIIKSNKIEDTETAYTLNVGVPSEDAILSIKSETNKNYSILYDFMDNLKQEQYVERINDEGKLERVYAPLVSSGTLEKKTSEADRAWWTKVTQYPIKIAVTLKGLLRPAILMTKVRLNVYFYGNKHIMSGLYLVTKQVDDINERGFTTTLNLLRIDKAIL